MYPSARCRGSSRPRHWFGRKNIPVWITEYGHETKPGEPAGITEAQQALYVTQAINLAKKDPRVPMFVWFVMRDSVGSLWQSGIYRLAGAAKPARPRFAAAAKPLSPVNGKVTRQGRHEEPHRQGLPAVVLRQQPDRSEGRPSTRRRRSAASWSPSLSRS